VTTRLIGRLTDETVEWLGSDVIGGSDPSMTRFEGSNKCPTVKV
jgi:hypothetical protein